MMEVAIMIAVVIAVSDANDGFAFLGVSGHGDRHGQANRAANGERRKDLAHIIHP